MVPIRTWSWLAALALLTAACGESEPAHAVVPPPAPAVELPAEYRLRIENFELAASTDPEDQAKAWEAYRSLRDGGEDVLAAILRLPDGDRPLLAMLKKWMKSAARAELGLTSLGEELAFREVIESPECRTTIVFRLERAGAGAGDVSTTKIAGEGLDRVVDVLVANRFWLQRGIRQVGAEDEALLTLTMERGGELVRTIEVWENEATTFNRSLGKIVAAFRELEK